MNDDYISTHPKCRITWEQFESLLFDPTLSLDIDYMFKQAGLSKQEHRARYNELETKLSHLKGAAHVCTQ